MIFSASLNPGMGRHGEFPPLENAESDPINVKDEESKNDEAADDVIDDDEEEEEEEMRHRREKKRRSSQPDMIAHLASPQAKPTGLDLRTVVVHVAPRTASKEENSEEGEVATDVPEVTDA
jgi:hypothetical protein